MHQYWRHLTSEIIIGRRYTEIIQVKLAFMQKKNRTLINVYYAVLAVGWLEIESGRENKKSPEIR